MADTTEADVALEHLGKIELELADVIAGQIERYGRFDATDVGSVRLAIAALEDETRETRDAWRLDRRNVGKYWGPWERTEDEALQVACVALRLVIDIRRAKESPVHE